MSSEAESLPWYVAPLPRPLEDLGLRLAWLIVAVNLVGTAFGFWYYRFQFAGASVVAWPFIPDSPMATLFIAGSLAAYELDLDADWLHMLAFVGLIKLGLWTPFVQLVVNGQGDLATWLYQFLVWSHLAMALEAFLVHRYATFSVRAVGVAVGWYLLNDVVDYFVPLAGEVHHTLLRGEYVNGFADHSLLAHDLAAAAAVTLTVLATFLALTTRVEHLKRERPSDPGHGEPA